jgi:hypothetical protein
MTRSAEASEQLSHVVIIDEKGKLIQVIELPKDIKPSEIEAFVTSEGSDWSYVPAAVALAGGAQFGSPQLHIPEGKQAKELFLGKLALPAIAHIHELGGSPEVENNQSDPPDLIVSAPTKSVGV